ncbi:Exodeoxyribonuclease 7 large subunit [subsurface metagenome]
MQPKPLSLFELNNQIKGILKTNCEKSYWVTGEISEIKVNHSGHCYLELIQKDPASDQIIARSRATIWATGYRMIKPYFETTTKQPLTTGLDIMIKVCVEFHEVYGLSLNITDIEPVYTIGELALRKQNVIQRLNEEGVLEMNKELEFPYLCHKIAVISSVTAAGYEDFMDQLLSNSSGYKFYVKLFPATMQGKEAEKSIISSLDKIYQYESVFDAVVIIRGGGSKADLSCFDSYWLAYHITQFPLPVLTGIGHEQDDSVVDLVAYNRFKTPTAVASFLIDTITEHDVNLHQVEEQIIHCVGELIIDTQEIFVSVVANMTQKIKDLVLRKNIILQDFNFSLTTLAKKVVYHKKIVLNKRETRLTISSKNFWNNRQQDLQTFIKILMKHLNFVFEKNKNRLERFDDRIVYLNPRQIMKRGYSITRKNGKVIKDSHSLEKGDDLETILYKGKIVSVLKKK